MLTVEINGREVIRVVLRGRYARSRHAKIPSGGDALDAIAEALVLELLQIAAFRRALRRLLIEGQRDPGQEF